MAPIKASVPPPTIPILIFRFNIVDRFFNVDQIKLTLFFQREDAFFTTFEGQK